MSETIRRVAERTKNYTTMMNEALKRPDLSARSKGVYAYLMTLPNDWIIRKEELQRHFTEGREAIDKAFKELVTAGYVTLKIERDDKRQISGYAYSIHELCIPEEERTLELKPGKLVTGNPETASPTSGNPLLLSTEVLPSTDLPKTDKEPKRKHGEFHHVLLTDTELDKLKSAFPLDWQQRITDMDEGIELKGYRYTSHYLAILKWAKRERDSEPKELTSEQRLAIINANRARLNRDKPQQPDLALAEGRY